MDSKMESLGRLAAGFAHDFNNLLTVILNYAELLESELKDNPKAKAKLDSITNCANKAANLTNQLLSFNARQDSKEQLIDLNSLVGSLGHMLARVLGSDIELKIEPCDKPALIMADPDQIGHVIMTLAHRAREAMQKGGELSFKIGRSELEISDTGIKLDAAGQKQVLEACEVLREGKGQVRLDTEALIGTKLRLSFPPVHQEQEPAVKREKGPETILVVEDENIVRQVACDIIRGSGYEVIEAVSALNALELCEKFESQIDLVLTDLVMPKMNGPELVKKLLIKFPQINVVYMSGYNSDAALSKGLEVQKTSFVQKPFMPKTLLKVLRDTLDGQVTPEA